MKKPIAWIILTVVALVAAFALALTNEQTKDIIKEQAQVAMEQARQDVLTVADRFEPGEVPEGSDFSALYIGFSGDNPVGYVAEKTVKGFAGPVELTIGMDDAFVITGVAVGGSGFQETAGLGAKAKDKAFTDQFVGKAAPLKLIKAGGTPSESSIDAITAATITSSAVIDGVSKSVSAIQRAFGDVIEEEVGFVPGSLVGTGEAQGFAGPVAVTVTVDPDHNILALVVGDARFAETPGFGLKAQDEDYTNQFVGKSLPLEAGAVDIISGATVTSNAVMAALAQAADNLAPMSVRVGKGVAQGFAGPVAVTIYVDDNDTILAIEIGDAAFAETPGFGLKALEDDFAKQFVAQPITLQASDIDMISGATVTSDAVWKAFMDAVATLETGDDPVVSIPEEVPAVASATYTGTAQGGKGPVTVAITLDGDLITGIVIGDDQFVETPGLGARALEEAYWGQFIGKTVPLQEGDIDALTGATITSKAVLAAIEDALTKTAVPLGLEDAAGDTITGTAQGFAGPVTVTLTLDGNVIHSIVIGDDAFAETPGFGLKAKDEAYWGQFIGKTLPLADGDIDAITMATITSNAVLAAIEDALTKTAVSLGLEDAAGDTITGTAKGFAGPVTVTLTLDGNVIKAITIGDDAFAETAGFGLKAKDEAYWGQFIGKTVPLADGDIDTITMATITHNAVLAAIEDALK